MNLILLQFLHGLPSFDLILYERSLFELIKLLLLKSHLVLVYGELVVINILGFDPLPAAPTIAALGWLWGGYDLVLALGIVFAALGLLALLSAWRCAS